MGLVAAEIERAGIPTAAQVFLREVAEQVRPPRALWVPFDHGFPLGAPNDPELQLDVLRETLALIERPGPGPVLAEYVPSPAFAQSGVR